MNRMRVAGKGTALQGTALRSRPPNATISMCTNGMTDPVYEGKSMQGMVDLVRKGWFPAGSKVLCTHLGGVPAINACSYIYRNG